MNKFFLTIRSILAAKDLHTRILNTLLFLAIYRAGTFIVLPGIDTTKIIHQATGMLAWLDRLLGGSLTTYSIFGFGITPYISASIMVQFLSISLPYFQRLKKEGPSGRNQLTQITRLIALATTLVQAIPYLYNIMGTDMVILSKYSFIARSLVLLTAGSMFCIWLADRITEQGVGHGTSMIIMVGIISSLPSAMGAEISRNGGGNILLFVIELVVLFFIILALIAFTQGTRRIPLQRPRQIVGTNALYSGRREYLPLKVNSAGVMPIIMASMISAVPRLMGRLLRDKSDMAARLEQVMSDINGWHYNLFLSILIFTTTYFYIAVFINPSEIANDLKRENAFVPGIKPGKPTASYIDDILNKITLPGSLCLALVAALPPLAYHAGVTSEFSKFFGGTSLLIIIGAIIELVEQVESYLFVGYYHDMIENEHSNHDL